MQQPARRLVARADGSLWLHAAGQAPCRMAVGVGTRLLGPSVFLDLLAASNPAGRPLRTWLTPARRASAGNSPVERRSTAFRARGSFVTGQRLR